VRIAVRRVLRVRGAASAVGLELIQERADQRRIELAEVEP
jgi:hypothetical protein